MIRLTRITITVAFAVTLTGCSSNDHKQAGEDREAERKGALRTHGKAFPRRASNAGPIRTGAKGERKRPSITMNCCNPSRNRPQSSSEFVRQSSAGLAHCRGARRAGDSHQRGFLRS